MVLILEIEHDYCGSLCYRVDELHALIVRAVPVKLIVIALFLPSIRKHGLKV